MAEAVGVAASIIAVLQITSTVIEYLNDVQEATSERFRLLAEVSSMQTLLRLLETRVTQAVETDAHATIQVLAGTDRPLQLLQKLLEHLVKKLQPKDKAHKKIGSALKWHFSKESVQNMMQQMDRLKSMFIAALANDQLSLSQFMQQDLKDLQQSLARVENNQIIHYQQLTSFASSFDSWKNDQTAQAVRKWLEAPDPNSNYDAALKKREPNTGSWFIDSSEFKDWKDEPDSFLWLHGKAGCGKSVLATTIIEHILKQCSNVSESSIAYFYFDFTDKAKQDCTNLLLSLVSQLAFSSLESYALVKDKYFRHNNGQSRPNLNMLSLLFDEITQLTGDFFLVIDALDECDAREDLLTWIEYVLSSKTSKQRALHLLALSRRERDIEEMLESSNDAGYKCYAMSIDDGKVDDDIRKYIQTQIQTNRRLKKWPVNIREHIEDVLMRKANGMYVCTFAPGHCYSPNYIQVPLGRVPTC